MSAKLQLALRAATCGYYDVRGDHNPHPRGNRNLLREFRGNPRASLPLHPLEKTLLVLVAINVCSLPWMLGGMRIWAQFIATGLSAVTFALALFPRSYRGDLVDREPYHYYPHRRLLRWPLWWVGLIFLGYTLVQALNPAYEFVQLDSGWGMRKIAHIGWLPTGMHTPFEMMNPWRQMMIWLIPFFLVNAVWIGFTRRKTITALLTAMVLNAALIAIVGLVARHDQPDKVLWLIDGIADYSFGSFIYKNHAGSFFLLMVGVSVGLAIWHHNRAKQALRRSGPASLFLLGSLLLAAAVLVTYSRGAILILAGFLTLTILATLIISIRSGANRQAPLRLAGLICLIVGFVAVSGYLATSTRTLERIEQLTQDSGSDRSVFLRKYAWEAGLEMANDRKLTGWGAGGFRFLFPAYQKNYPKIVWLRWRIQRDFMFWEHVHNDYLQVLIETGRLGLGIVGLGLIFYLWSFHRGRGFSHLFAASLLTAAALVMIHATIDFPLQNPAVLCSWAVVMVLASLVAHLSPAPRISRPRQGTAKVVVTPPDYIQPTGGPGLGRVSAVDR